MDRGVARQFLVSSSSSVVTEHAALQRPRLGKCQSKEEGGQTLGNTQPNSPIAKQDQDEILRRHCCGRY